MSLSDFSVLMYNPPRLDQLNITQGEVYIGWPTPRYGRPLYLITNGKKIKFNCELLPTYGLGCQFDKNVRGLYQGKQAKVRWFSTSNFGLVKDNRLYQLEVDGKIIISYEFQKNRYLNSKQANSYFYLMSFIVACVFFYILQLESGSIKVTGEK